MKRIVTLCVGALALTIATTAQAEMSANKLLDMYDTGDAELRDLLETVIDGNSNGVSWVNSYLDEYRGTQTQVYCPPDDFTIDGPGMIDMMREAIANDARYGELPYGATVMFTYIDKFPCR
ncbi:hypothetical protein ACFL12_04395 [Pseudomonadota bacterium]